MSRFKSPLLDPTQVKSYLIIDMPNFIDYDISEALMPTRIGLTSLAFGFSAATMPEVEIVTEQVNQGIMVPPIDIITGVTIGSVTLTRGVYVVDAEFYNWVRMAAAGETYGGMFRRDLLIILFKERVGFKIPDIPLLPKGIPFRAYFMSDVIPVRYKPGSDLQGDSSELSLQEIELKPQNMYQVDAGSLLGL